MTRQGVWDSWDDISGQSTNSRVARGVDLFGNGGEGLQRRLDQIPGVHGCQHARQQRETEYAQQLREKQKVKRMYGLLERRLDNVIYRLGWARTRSQAHQCVSHGHIVVDGQPVDIPSYLVGPGQMVRLGYRLQRHMSVEHVSGPVNTVPAWLMRREFQADVLCAPHREEIDGNIDEQRIVEFYSR